MTSNSQNTKCSTCRTVFVLQFDLLLNYKLTSKKKLKLEETVCPLFLILRREKLKNVKAAYIYIIARPINKEHDNLLFGRDRETDRHRDKMLTARHKTETLVMWGAKLYHIYEKEII